MTPRTKVWLGISLGVTVLAIAIFFLFFYKARLTIVPTPASAQVLINGQLVNTATTTKLSPGTYQILVRATGYLPETTSLRLGVSQIMTLPVKLRAIPTPTSSQNDIRYPTMTQNDDQIFYLGNGGKQFFLADTNLGPDGKAKTQAITDSHFADITKVVWSPDQSLMVYQTTNGKTHLFDFKRYDLLHQEDRELEDNQHAVVWHPSEREVVSFSAPPNGERTLLAQNLLTNTSERLIDLRPYQLTDPQLVWSADGQTIAIIESKVYLFDVNTRVLKQVVGLDGATAASFSPDSTKLVVETSNGLVLVKRTDTGITPLTLRTTMNKTAWTADSKALLVATTTDQGVDQLQKINLSTLIKTQFVFNSPTQLHLENLFIDKQTKYLWFTSEGMLYQLLLEETTQK